MMPWRAKPVRDRVPRLDDTIVRAPGQAAPAKLKEPATLALVKWLYALKDERPFPELRGVAGEAAWDILLDLYRNELQGRQTSVTSACISARTPSTSALRQVRMLCGALLVERMPDERDGRRHWLRLSPEARRALDRYLHDMADDLRKVLPLDG